MTTFKKLTLFFGCFLLAAARQFENAEVWARYATSRGDCAEGHGDADQSGHGDQGSDIDRRKRQLRFFNVKVGRYRWWWSTRVFRRPRRRT